VCEAVKGVELSGPADSSLLDNLAKKVIFNLSMFFSTKKPLGFLYCSSESIFYSPDCLQCQEGLADTGGNVGSMEFVSILDFSHLCILN
jgi:hypothetical protein